MRYQFDDFELDTEQFELRQAGKALKVEPMVFDLLCFLTKNTGRVVVRDEIIDHVWNGRVVSDATVASCVKSARKALGDTGDAQTYIKTIRGRGFQFVGEVQTENGSLSEVVTPLNKREKASFNPSLIILPFEVFGDGVELIALSDGLVENLTTILTRVPLLALTSRSSSFALKGQSYTAEEINERFKVSYMLEGSVQLVEQHIRVNVQLIETKNGFHLWAQDFEKEQSASVMLELLQDILPRLETQLVRAMFNDLKELDGELSAKSLLLQGIGVLTLKGWHRDTFIEAADLLRRAIHLAPELALARAYLALTLGLGHRVGLLDKSQKVIDETITEVNAALEIDNFDSNVLGLCGCALADIGEVERAVPLLKNAIDINPNNAQAWTALGSAYLVTRRTDEAIKHLSHGIEISPMDNRLSVWFALLALAFLQKGDLDQALETAQSGCQSDDKSYIARVALAGVYFARGEHDDAAKVLADCYRVKPDLSAHEIDSLIGKKLGGALRA